MLLAWLAGRYSVVKDHHSTVASSAKVVRRRNALLCHTIHCIWDAKIHWTGWEGGFLSRWWPGTLDKNTRSFLNLPKVKNFTLVFSSKLCNASKLLYISKFDIEILWNAPKFNVENFNTYLRNFFSDSSTSSTSMRVSI